MEAGQVLHGRYELLELIGKGGMGQVWKALDRQEQRHVAIKGLTKEPTQEAGIRRRLELEAQTLAGLRHDRIVNILAEFEEGGELYLVMQYIDGPNLSQAASAGQLSAASKVAILIGVLEALTYLHEGAEVLHRDLKPSNIILDRQQRAYVTDFGIARTRLDADATKSMATLGSWPYAAPEVRAGKPASERSDVWSFGAVALWLFTGRQYDEGIPAGDFAGSLTEDIRAALSPRRPSASDLLEAFRRAEREGLTGPVHAAQHDGLTRAIPAMAAAGAAGDDAPKTRPIRAVAASAPSRRRKILPIILVLAALIGVAALASAMLRPSPEASAPPPVQTSPAVETPSPSPTPTVTPTPTPSPTASASSSATVSSAPLAAGPTWYYLADMDYIQAEIESGNCQGGCTGFMKSPGSIAGNVYPRSFAMRLLSTGVRSTALWNAYTKCTTFEATIGLDDSSASVKTHFLLEREGGATEDLGIVNTGVAKKVSVDLTGVFRFKLVSYLAEATKGTAQKALWGDARMLCSPLPTPQP